MSLFEQARSIDRAFRGDADPARRRVLRAGAAGTGALLLAMLPHHLASQEIPQAERFKAQLALCDGLIGAHDAGDKEVTRRKAASTPQVSVLETNAYFLSEDIYNDTEEGIYAVHDLKEAQSLRPSELKTRLLSNVLADLDEQGYAGLLALDCKFTAFHRRALQLTYQQIDKRASSRRMAIMTDEDPDLAYEFAGRYGDFLHYYLTMKNDPMRDNIMKEHIPNLRQKVIKNVGVYLLS